MVLFLLLICLFFLQCTLWLCFFICFFWFFFLLLIFSFLFVFLFWGGTSSCCGSGCVCCCSAVSSSSSFSSFLLLLLFLLSLLSSSSSSSFSSLSSGSDSLIHVCSEPASYLVFLVTRLVFLHFWTSWRYKPEKGAHYFQPMFSSISGGCDGGSSVSWEVKKGNLVPPCRCLSSSLLLAGHKNTRKIVFSGDNSSSKVIRVNGDVSFLAEKRPKNTTNIGVKKRVLFAPVFRYFFGAFRGLERGRPENEVKK